MRLLGLLIVFGSSFAFMAAFAGVHDALPGLVADATTRAAVERCVVDNLFMFLLGTSGFIVGFVALYEGEVRLLARQTRECAKALEARVATLERENRYKDELLGRIEALEGRRGVSPPKS